ncbi:MAG: hypothetical protein ABSA92_15405 [Candidatus Bathyarchaeia archaeon]
MIIDAFNHFYSKEYVEALPQDLQYRLSIIDKFGVDMQVLSIFEDQMTSMAACEH